MDKIYNFQAKTQTGHIKKVLQNEQKLQFYSEEEGDTKDSKDNTPKEDKKQQIHNGYQTDDSESGTPKHGTAAQKPPQSKSRFCNLVNSKQMDGDNENEPEFSDNERIQQLEQQEHQYNIEEQAQLVQQKLKQTNPITKLNKTKQTLSQQQLGCNSDNDKGKKKQEGPLKNHPFKHLIFGTEISESNLKKHLLLTQRGLIYAKKCLKGPSDKFIKSKQVNLAEAKVKKEKAIILDLDETLIHSCQPRFHPQVTVTAYGDNGEEAQIGINIRPYVGYFLQKISQHYTIYVFTASSQAYATAIIQRIDPDGFISGVLTRNNCMETKNGFFIKDLRIIANKELKNMLIVDNLAHSFGFQIENGIPILEWHDDQSDQELKYLVDYLIQGVTFNDLREYNKQLKLDELMEHQLEE